MGSKSIIILNVGLIGFAVLIALNLVAHFSFHQPASELFRREWWSVWAPSYLIWIAFIVVGLGGLLKAKHR